MLLDTGPLVALLDRSEHNHARCVTFFKEFRGRLVTTEPVLTEAMYLLGPDIAGQRACLRFIIQGGAVLIPSTAKTLSRCLALMEQYRDIPMDFADATLVALAEEIGITEVFTLDVKDFNIYCLREKKTFTIYPKSFR
ncbi:MAG: PIN domain-containing protein [Deltaproteobacteria bacterium]|nr:PIN domain-containing protein [Deltaproteobacteria bacterium]